MKITLPISTLLLGFLMTFIGGCSEDEEPAPLFVKPSLPEYAVGVISNEESEIKFDYLKIYPLQNRRLEISPDTSRFDLRFSGESQDGLTHSFVLTFFWDERTGTPYDAKMWLVYNHGDIRFEIKFADENVTGGHVPVTLEISNFERDIEKKEIAFDFHMKIDPAQTTLKLVTTITGAMKFKNYGDP